MPNRIIRDTFPTSDDYAQLTLFQRDLFWRLVVTVDDFGRYEARPEILRGRLFPLENVTTKAIEEGLTGLVNAGIAIIYSVKGRAYLHLEGWERNQTRRAKNSKYPAPEDGILCETTKSASICEQMSAYVSEESRNEESRNEERGSAPTRHKYGQFGWVLLSLAEHDRLISDLGETELLRCIKYIDESAQLTGNKNKWKDWNLVIRKCSRDKWGIREGEDKPRRSERVLNG